jgi:hypothetical protein
MPRDDAFGDFRELLLLQQTPFQALVGSGALGLFPFTVAAAVVVAVAPHHDPAWVIAAVVGYGAVVGAVTAWAYRRGQIPYRRGDWAAAAAFTVFLTPAVVIGSRAAGAELAVGLAAVLSVLPSLALEVCWRPLFLAALRRLSHLNLDLLVHESLREHYGDDWQAYAAHIRADLREARRLRELAERGPAKTDEP